MSLSWASQTQVLQDPSDDNSVWFIIIFDISKNQSNFNEKQNKTKKKQQLTYEEKVFSSWLYLICFNW